MTPLLVLLFGVPASVAVGTDLLYAAITKAGTRCKRPAMDGSEFCSMHQVA